jgi:hypothetical protein
MPHGSENEAYCHDKVNWSHPKVQTRSRKARSEAKVSGSTSEPMTIIAAEKPHAIVILETDCDPTQFHIARI